MQIDMIRILFLSADPSDAARLRLNQEERDIREKLQRAKERDNFSLDTRQSVRSSDITQAILDVRPNIVHFSGHGMSTGELCVENIVGKIQPVTPSALASLFELFSESKKVNNVIVSCVILNACYSKAQAAAISKHIPFVIGMNKDIGDPAAIAFAVGFYTALGAGCSFENAFEVARVAIQMENIEEHLTPVLYKQGSWDDSIQPNLETSTIDDRLMIEKASAPSVSIPNDVRGQSNLETSTIDDRLMIEEDPARSVSTSNDTSNQTRTSTVIEGSKKKLDLEG
jgi:hypothetical protein